MPLAMRANGTGGSGARGPLLRRHHGCELLRDALLQVEALRGFPAEGLRRLAAAARLRAFDAGSELVRQGQPGDRLYVIVRGRVRVQRSHPSLRAPLVLAELGPGEIMGEMGILDGEPRSATAIALDEVQALEIEAEALVETLREAPGAAGALLRLLSGRLRDSDELIGAAVGRLHQQQELILSTVDDAICLLDEAGRITYINPAGARLLGYALAELSGRPFHQVVHAGDDHDVQTCGVLQALRGDGANRGIDEGYRRRDGTTFPAEYDSTPIWEEGRVAGVVLTFKDVTDRRAIERMKDEFVAIVSHELRTPLTSIRGSLGLLAGGQMGELSDRAQRMLEIATSNADRLVRLVSDLLDIERIEMGRATMERVDTEAAELMAMAADLMRPVAAKAGVCLVVEPVHAPLVADPDRIVQTLTNLLSNAVKFSPVGGRVWLQAARNDGFIEFRVRDEGRGIPPDKLEVVFERFRQVDASDTREKGGAGLGLSICQSIVQQHGGKIWAESEPRAGATLCFTLPATE